MFQLQGKGVELKVCTVEEWKMKGRLTKRRSPVWGCLPEFAVVLYTKLCAFRAINACYSVDRIVQDFPYKTPCNF